MQNQHFDVMIITSSNISGDGIGSFFIKDLLATIPNIKIYSKVFTPYLMRYKKKSLLSRIKISILARIGLFQFIRLVYFRKFVLEDYIRSIELDFKSSQSDCIWIVTSTPELIFIGERLVNKGYDVRVTVWDDPEYLAKNLRVPRFFKNKMIESFGVLLNKSNQGMVISNTMHKKYKKEYNFNSEVVRHGLDKKHITKNKNTTQKIKIVFAGSLYSKKEWNCFIEALSDINWNLLGKEICVYYIGDFPLYGANKKSNITFLGRRSFDETIELLTEMDIGYLPYWFSKDFREVAETSFPGKMSAYACSGLAVFHHAPSYTEVTDFLSIYPFGVCCDSLNSKDIIDNLKILINDLNSDLYNKSRFLAVKNELSNSANIAKLNRFLSNLASRH